MTGFRSGKNGSLDKGAKAAGRAIGKRKRYSAGSLFQIFPKPFTIPSSKLLFSKPEPKHPFFAPFPVVRKKQKETPAVFPIRPRSATAEMWEDYRVFKAAGLLHKWREKWAGYLAIPA